MTAKLTMDQGEWATAAVDFSGLEAPWDDLVGATVTLYAERTQPTPKETMATTTGALDPAGADGKYHSAYVQIPTTWTEGSYFCTLVVSKAGNGYPQKQSFELVIERVAPAP